MRWNRIYLLTIAVALLGALYGVLGPGPEPEPPSIGELHDSFAGTLDSDGTSSTTLALVFSATATKPLVLSDAELDLTEEMKDRATSTTSSTTTTSTTTTAETTAKPAPGATTTTTTVSSTTTSAPAATSGFRSDFEADFHGRINSLRSSNGLGGLSRDGSLNARARDWAKHMSDNNDLRHSSLSSLVPPWSSAAENIGKGGSVDAIFSSLANSSGHRSSMLGDFTAVGIGAWVDSSGVIWTVHIFAR